MSSPSEYLLPAAEKLVAAAAAKLAEAGASDRRRATQSARF